MIQICHTAYKYCNENLPYPRKYNILLFLVGLVNPDVERASGHNVRSSGQELPPNETLNN